MSSDDDLNMPADSAQLREMVERATPEQRLALAKAGITLAVLQEKLRMGFTNEEVATVLATASGSCWPSLSITTTTLR